MDTVKVKAELESLKDRLRAEIKKRLEDLQAIQRVLDLLPGCSTGISDTPAVKQSKARAAALTPERKSEIAIAAANARWDKPAETSIAEPETPIAAPEAENATQTPPEPPETPLEPPIEPSTADELPEAASVESVDSTPPPVDKSSTEKPTWYANSAKQQIEAWAMARTTPFNAQEVVDAFTAKGGPIVESAYVRSTLRKVMMEGKLKLVSGGSGSGLRAVFAPIGWEGEAEAHEPYNNSARLKIEKWADSQKETFTFRDAMAAFPELTDVYAKMILRNAQRAGRIRLITQGKGGLGRGKGVASVYAALHYGETENKYECRPRNRADLLPINPNRITPALV